MNANQSDPAAEDSGGGLSAGTLRALVISAVVVLVGIAAFFQGLDSQG